MKTIIAGSRNICDYRLICIAVEKSDIEISEVISGRALGVDRLGEKWAISRNISIRTFLPDWRKYNKSAGFIRNLEMIKYADALIAIWDGTSKGTKHTIDNSIRSSLEVHVYLEFDLIKAMERCKNFIYA